MRPILFVLCLLLTLSSAYAVQYIAPSNGANQSIGSSNLLFVDNTNARVGIGTATPSTKFAVSGGPIRVFDGSQTISLGSDAGVMRLQTDGTNMSVLNSGNAYAPFKAVSYYQGDTQIIDSSRNIVNAGTGAFSGALSSTTLNTGNGANELFAMDQNVRTSDSPSFVKLTSTQATGTAPFTVSSTTVVTNLNADKVDGQDYSATWPTTLANIQSVTTSDFHNIGGTDDDTAETDAKVADAITVSGGTIGTNTISSGATWNTAGTLTIGDGGDRIDVNSNSWDVTNGAMSGVTSLNGGLVPINQDGGRYTTDFNTLLATGFYNAEATPTNSPGGSYGQLVVARGIDTGLQIYGGYANDNLWFRGWDSYGTHFSTWRKVWHDGNDGAGSGLDADLLDGISSGSFLRSDTSATFSGTALTIGNDLTIRTDDSSSDPGTPWMRSNGGYLVINPTTGNDIYLAWDAGAHVYFGAGADVRIRNGVARLGGSDYEALRGTDTWLRLNNAGDFSSGVYTPGIMRSDGGFLTVASGAYSSGSVCGASGTECFNFRNDGWVYLSDTSFSVYGGKGVAADKFWANTRIYTPLLSDGSTDRMSLGTNVIVTVG